MNSHSSNTPSPQAELLQQIRWIILDVDGVLTDGSIMLSPDGKETKVFSVKDGLALAAWKRAGFHLGIITGRSSAAVTLRAEALGFDAVLRGVSDKAEGIQMLSAQYDFALSDVAYMGDDLPDLPALRLVGLKWAPADAANEVLEIADWVSEKAGGRGAVRELIEKLLREKGLWESANVRYL